MIFDVIWQTSRVIILQKPICFVCDSLDKYLAMLYTYPHMLSQLLWALSCTCIRDVPASIIDAYSSKAHMAIQAHSYSWEWRHNERDSVSDNQPHVCSTVYSGAYQRKHQSSASLAFVWGIHRWPVDAPHKRPVTRKLCPFDDVFMLSGWCQWRVQMNHWVLVINLK